MGVLVDVGNPPVDEMLARGELPHPCAITQTLLYDHKATEYLVAFRVGRVFGLGDRNENNGVYVPFLLPEPTAVVPRFSAQPPS